MKGKIALGLTVLLTLVVAGVAYAHDTPSLPPVEPVCPAGQVTVTGAVWVPAVETCPARTFAASRTVVDVAAHTEHRHYQDHPVHAWGPWQDGHCSGQGQCEERTVPAVTHLETFGPITVQYTPGEHHCQRPTAESEGVPSWARDDYNDDLPEHLEKIITPGYWIEPVCRAAILGCTDPLALNYDPVAEVDDGSCEYYIPPEPIPGCTDPLALNYDQTATVDDGSCEYYVPPEPVPGCTDPEALNYNAEATADDGSCEYYVPPEPTPSPTPEPEACLYTVTTYFQCATGAAIWVEETGIASGEGTNLIGAAPYNRNCPWCNGITGQYHREWRSDCDGSGWDEGAWDLPDWMHELNGCPLGGRCGQ